MAGSYEPAGVLRGSVVIFVAEVSDQILTLHPAQRVLELHGLNEQVVLGVQPLCRHRALEVEAQPLLHTPETGALGEIEQQREIEDERRRPITHHFDESIRLARELFA